MIVVRPEEERRRERDLTLFFGVRRSQRRKVADAELATRKSKYTFYVRRGKKGKRIGRVRAASGRRPMQPARATLCITGGMPFPFLSGSDRLALLLLLWRDKFFLGPLSVWQASLVENETRFGKQRIEPPLGRGRSRRGSCLASCKRNNLTVSSPSSVGPRIEGFILCHPAAAAAAQEGGDGKKRPRGERHEAFVVSRAQKDTESPRKECGDESSAIPLMHFKDRYCCR